ncbi:hypothetical protein MSAN_00424100 [Mycena sanguinolenta]|uniref:Uncharacterized protein n=1 Tax=Mycena sanguinolenta TaxID=230812 RepID=A0A8H6ZFM4_9AGAR|nr:hypothetical protein MSAN_00424100 [Mycena sanguinolenta]
MATPRLPSYASYGDERLEVLRSPSYSAEPGLHEQRLALNARSLPQPTGNFVKVSKHGGITLRLLSQEDDVDLPVYSSGAIVEGTVELSKTDSISSVDFKVEGHLELKENAEGGHTHHILCMETAELWCKGDDNSVCPSSLRFSVALPTAFEHEGQSYPLPPSHSIKLKGLPGFTANIDYSISAMIHKPHPVSINSKTLGIHIGDASVSTPFIYYPRTRPPFSTPSPLHCTEAGEFTEGTGWQVYQSVVKANAPNGVQDIGVKFYLPASRIFCVSEAIPFHITLESDAHSLAAFLPYGPIPGTSTEFPATRIQVMRQSTVDVKHTTVRSEHANTAIWSVDYFGEAEFRHARDGPTRMSFSGEVKIQPTKITGFTVPGLIAFFLTVSPPEGVKAPFADVREVVPIRLATDMWADDAAGAHKETM